MSNPANTSRTADLAKLITTKLNSVSGGTTYRRQAPTTAAFPYKVFELARVDLGDLSRCDYDLQIDLWDRSTDTKTIDAVADSIEDIFNAENLPQATILPTFYRSTRYPVADPDKDLQHIQLHFDVQLYTTS